MFAGRRRDSAAVWDFHAALFRSSVSPVALIYRSIFDVEEPEFVERVKPLVVDWLQWKLDKPEIELSPGTAVIDEESGIELSCFEGRDGASGVFRVRLYENRVGEGEQVASTFTALCDGSRAWSWMDVERWATRQDATPWIAYAPSLVRSILGSSTC